MAEASPELLALIEHGREERDLEYKGSSQGDPYVWTSPAVKEKLARTAMAMANIGGGAIVIGMDQRGSDEWEANGISPEVDASYKQDDVQAYMKQCADPYVRLNLQHVDFRGKRFVVMQVSGFDELPVVCCSGSGRPLRPGAIYTRSFGKYETIEIPSQSEMRELLERAIDIGIRKRIEPFESMLQRLAEISAMFPGYTGPPENDEQRFTQQRGGP